MSSTSEVHVLHRFRQVLSARFSSSGACVAGRRKPPYVSPATVTLAAGALLAIAGGPASAQPAPVSPSDPCFGGRYPHLAVSNAQGECGIGAVVPWAGRLWFVTYAPHARRGSDDRLYEVDGQLRITARPESVGGTPAARFIHAATRQLLIGPYVINAQGGVRAIPPAAMEGRLSAAARHPTDPDHKVLIYDMEGLLYELDLKTYEPRLVVARAAPGWHGKGMYSGQGVVVVANNGEHAAGLKNFEPFLYAIPNERASREEAGVLAEWSPAEGRGAWRLVRRRQFTDVTGPGGIAGPTSPDAPIWAIGWDEKSVLLMTRSAVDAAAGRDPWHTFRLPKACGSYDGDHGWHTEWPRIREVTPASDGKPAKFILTMHGGWYEFPASFSAETPGGIRPLCSHLKITGDVAPWELEGRPTIVFGCDDTAKSGFLSEHQNARNDLNGRSNSNLWFTTWERLGHLGRPAGVAYALRKEPAIGGRPSDPLLLAGHPGGYDQRVVHLAHDAAGPVVFRLEVMTGREWREIVSLSVPAKGSIHHVLPADVDGDWIRVTPDRDAADVTVVFRFGTRGGVIEDPALFSGLADACSPEPWIAAVVRSGGDASLPLDVLAHDVDASGAVERDAAWRIGPDRSAAALASDSPAAAFLRYKAVPTSPDVSFDDASVILTEGTRIFRLPKPLDPATAAVYEKPFATGWPRGLREVVTERSLLNAAGTFYVLPRVSSGGAAKLQPVCSHGKRITDFCSWRGLLVLGGVRRSASPFGPDASDSRVIGGIDEMRRECRGPAVWVGDIDELWKFPRPTGRGGPWRDSPVEAGRSSDPYLMGGYDRKRLELSHDRSQPVRVTVEIDPSGDAGWFDSTTIDVPANETVVHEFPRGFSCQWVRLRLDHECRATAIFTYE